MVLPPLDMKDDTITETIWIWLFVVKDNCKLACNNHNIYTPQYKMATEMNVYNILRPPNASLMLVMIVKGKTHSAFWSQKTSMIMHLNATLQPWGCNWKRIHGLLGWEELGCLECSMSTSLLMIHHSNQCDHKFESFLCVTFSNQIQTIDIQQLIKCTKLLLANVTMI